MSDLKEKFGDISRILDEYELEVEIQPNGMYEITDSRSARVMYDIEDLNELHSCLLAYEEGYDAAIKAGR